MPKEVDHPTRRRELADSVCRVVARYGLLDTTLALVAEQSSWSIGSIRHYFHTKDDLVASALWRVGERIDARIRRRTAGGMTLDDLRVVAHELLPLDAPRREESLVYLAFAAQAGVVPELQEQAEEAARRLQAPLAARVTAAVEGGELPAHLDAEHEAARLRLLFDGLSVQMVTTPRHTTRSWAVQLVEEHLAALASSQPDGRLSSGGGSSTG